MICGCQQIWRVPEDVLMGREGRDQSSMLLNLINNCNGSQIWLPTPALRKHIAPALRKHIAPAQRVNARRQNCASTNILKIDGQNRQQKFSKLKVDGSTRSTTACNTTSTLVIVNIKWIPIRLVIPGYSKSHNRRPPVKYRIKFCALIIICFYLQN